MLESDPRPNVSTADLIREAIEESRALLSTEVALAKEEAKEELLAVKWSAIAFGAGALLATLALAMLFVALVMSIAPHWLTALITGLILLLLAGGAGLWGYIHLPKKVLEKTQTRIEEDVHLLKERIA